jgi:hypothetical protein
VEIHFLVVGFEIDELIIFFLLMLRCDKSRVKGEVEVEAEAEFGFDLG